MKLVFTAQERDNGRKVYNVLRGEMRISATLLRRMKRCGSITVDGKEVFTDHLLKPGETLAADISSAEPECDIVPENGEADILYENDGLIVVNKPEGIIVHPSRAKYTGTLSNYICGYLLSRGEEPVCHAVNRLDRDTSGAVLFAKNTYMKSLLSDSISDADKTYIAVIFGSLPDDSGTIDAPIRRVQELDMRREVSPDGQRAVTHYRVLKKCGDFSLVELKLETGRTHQIRVHLSYLGCPILGDSLYATDGSKAFSEQNGIDSQLLHAVRLSFRDPVSNCTLNILAPVKRRGFELCDFEMSTLF